MAAGQAQRIADADPSRRIAICDARGAARWSDVWLHNPILAHPADVARGERVHRLRNAPGCRPYIVYPFTRQTGWTFAPAWRATEHRGRIYLTAAERAIGARVRESGAYVVIEPSPPAKNPNRAWLWDRWIAVRAARPDLRWVQPAHATTRALAGVELTPTTSFREACGLLAGARAYVGTEGGLAHAAAALGVPAVVLFGGCVSVRALGYDDHVNLADDWPGSPCGSWRPCAHCAAARARITVAHVLAGLHTVIGGSDERP